MTYIKTKTYHKEISVEIDPVKDLAIFMHNEYEKIAKEKGWNTQKKTQVKFNKLPEENKETMLEIARRVMTWFENQGVNGYDDFYKHTCIKNEVFGK